MTSFILNKTYANQVKLEAERFDLGEKWVTFYNAGDYPIYVIQADRVGSIEIEGAAQGNA